MRRDSFKDKEPRPSSGKQGHAPPRRQATFSAGDVIGEAYEVVSLLGTGGMGQVYEANDLHLKRRVAVKVAWPEADLPSLLQEAQALAAVQHPCVVTVYSVGRHREAEYLVMERIYGVSLQAHLDQRRRARQRFTIPEALDLLGGIADGLAAVHRAGISHRDVKPGNVMLAPGNRIVLMDFGLFSPEFSRPGSSSPAGSPDYMAPEVITGRVEPGAGRLVDLYALGVIAFEVLTGDVPFPDGPIVEVLFRHLHNTPPRPTTLRNEIPGALDQLVVDLLAKDPRERPHSAEAVAWQVSAIRARLDEIRPSSQRLSVLVISAHADLAQKMVTQVRRTDRNAQVTTVRGAEEALAAIRRGTPDVILIDLELPRMSGVELCMYLRGTNLADPCAIIAIGRKASDEDLRLLGLLGVTEFLPKNPRLPERLAETLTDLRKRLRASE